MRRVAPALLLALLTWACVQRDVISVTIAQVSVQPETIPAAVGATVRFTGTVEDADGRIFPTARVEWSVEKPEIATVDSEGAVTTLAPGTTEIYATFRNVVGVGTLVVAVPPAIALNPDSVLIAAASGAGQPDPVAVLVSNSSESGSLTNLATQTFYDAPPEGWLQVALSNTRAPADISLSADTDGLPVGDYEATVAITSPDDPSGPAALVVRLSVVGVSIDPDTALSIVESAAPDTIRVSLQTAPDTAVVLAVASADPTEVTATPATLTFTPLDWDIPQIIEVRGVDENVADGDQTVDIVISVDDDLSDDRFDPILNDTISVTSLDDDTPDITIVETGGSTSVDEAGSTDQFTVVLDVEPLSPVVFEIERSDPTEASAGPTSLTFTPADWATPQTITVTGVDDDLIDGDVASSVTITVDPVVSHPAFGTLAPDTVGVTTIDNDVAGISVVTSTPQGSEAETEVSESGSTDDLQVVLTARPGSDVRVTLTPGDPGEVSTTPTSLTFTSANWDSPQSVTVGGVDDSIIDGPQSTPLAIGVDPANSNDDFDAVADTVITVVTADDDQAGISILESDGETRVAESGSSDTFTLELSAQPSSNVVFDVSSRNTGEVTVTPASLTFTPTTWTTPQVVTATGVDELIDDGDVLTSVDIRVNPGTSDDDFDLLPDDSVVVTTTDDDTAGWIITETSGATLVSETGSADQFDVVLTSEPLDTVVLTLLASDPTEAGVTPLALTFAPTDWNVPQTVTVTGVDDVLDDEDQFSIIAVGVSQALSDDTYDPLPDQTVQVTTTDNDSPAGFSITAIGGTTVTEAGGTDNFTVVLDTEPATDVVFDLTSSDPGEAILSAATLTFTPIDWDTPQTVTVSGVDDDFADGPQTSTLSVAVNDAASDDTFDPLPDEALTATTTDDDIPGFTVVESDGNTLVGEGASTDDFTVVLSARPLLDVLLSVSSGDLGEATVAPSTLTFTTDNWSTPQTVTVTGVNDIVIDGSQFTTVTLQVDPSSDDTFDPVSSQMVSVQTTDNDIPGISVAESGGATTVSETGTIDQFSIVLDSEPETDVLLSVASTDAGEVAVAPDTVTFTNASWLNPQVVTVTGVDDPILDGDVTTTIEIAVIDGLSEDGYTGLSATVVSTTTDDDGAGFTITETGPGSSVGEGGTTDSFSIVLDAQPASAVVLDIASDDTGEVAPSPVQVTFTVGTWDVPQSVTLTGVDDPLTDGDQMVTISVSVNASGSDDDYDAVPTSTILVTNADDDVADLVVTQTDGGTTVTEAGGQDQFSVQLSTQPVDDVILDIVASDNGEAVISPTALTFTNADWDTPQVVTVTGVNDPVIDGNQVSTATISVGGASDGDFLSVGNQVVTITTSDDDDAGFVVSESGAESVVTEAGSTDDVTVVLTAQPASDVVLSIVSADSEEVTVSPATLTFTAENWDVAQAVTLTGVDELVDDGDQTTDVTISVVDGSSDDAFDSATDQIVSVTTSDDDVAGITVVETENGTLVNETGTTDDFTVVLDAEPLTNVVLGLSSGDTGEVTASPTSLVFTPTDWSTPQTVTVTGVDDILPDGSQFTDVTITVDAPASDDAYDSVVPVVVTVTTTDNDAPAGVTVTAIGGTTVTEAGSTDDFTVVLDAEPATDVVINVSSGDTGEATVNPSALTFTPANWDQVQTVTITGVDDDILDGTQNTIVTIAVDDGLSDDAYDPVADQTTPVVTTDDDIAGFTLTETSGSTVVNEGGTTDGILVVLDAEPATNVTVTVSSNDTGEATVSASPPLPLVFTPTDWDTPQTVTVTGEDDDNIDGSQITTITFAIDAGASDDDFDGVADQTVDVTTTDNDAAGISLTATDGSTIVDESGTTDDFTVVLTSGPATDVVVAITSGDTGEATVSPTTLTFTSANWFTPQSVTVTGVNDDQVDGDRVTTVTVTVNDAASDDAYDGLSQSIDVTTSDDDAPGFSLTESGPGTSVSEPSTTDDFTVTLSARPATNVVIDLSSGDAGEVSVSPTTLTFTNASWDSPQTVTLTAVDDDLIDGVQITDVTLAVDALLSDDAYDLLPDVTVSVATADDDLAGFAVTESGGGTQVTEAGGTDQFTVVLNVEPAADVVLDAATADPGEVTVTPTQVTFTPANWDIPQTITAAGQDDDVIDGSQATTLTISVDAVASDDAFDLVPEQTVSATTTDDDAAGFAVVETASSTQVSESGTTDSFNVVLTAEPGSDVVLTISADDATEALVDLGTLTFTSEDWDTPQTVTVSAVDDQIDDGSVVSTITVSVDEANSDDDFDLLLDQVFNVTTLDDDDAGFTVVETLGSTVVSESGGVDEFTVVLDTEPVGDVELLVSSADVMEATVAPTTLTFTPVTWNTPQQVDITGVDDPVSDGNQITTVTISVNDGPSDDAFDTVADQVVSVTTVDDDQAGFVITQTDGGTSVREAGTSDDFTIVLTAQPASNVVLIVSNGDPTEISTAPAELTFTSLNWATPQTVTVTGVDDAFDDGDRFTLITISVDDPSSDSAYDPLPDQQVSATTLDDDGVGFTISQSEGNTVVSEAGSTDAFDVVLLAQPTENVTITVSSADTGEAIVSASPPLPLVFTTLDWFEAQTVTVTGQDDVIDDGDVVTLVSVAVDAANSDDDYDGVETQTVGVTTTDDDDAGFAVTESASSSSVTETGDPDDISVVLLTEPTTDVVLSVSSEDTGEVTTTPSQLTFTALNWQTPQSVTLNGIDDGIDDGDVVTNVVVSVVDLSSDDAFDALPDQTVAVTTVDNDEARFQVTESGGSTVVSEAGATDGFTIQLETQPVSSVVLNITSGDPGEVVVDVSSIIFTPGDWNTPQTVTVTGVDDLVDDGSQASTITISVNAGSSDDAFDALANQTVTVTTTDDDVAGFSITEPGGSTTVSETGTQDIFNVVLDAEPLSDVVLTIASDDPGEVDATPTSLTFSPGNWNVAQSVTVTGIDDALTDGSVITNVVVSVDDVSSNDTFDPVADQTVPVTTTDDDVAGFSVTESEGSSIVSESGSTDTFDVALTSRPVDDVVLDISSADLGEVSSTGVTQLTFTNSDWNQAQTVTLTGVDDAVQDGPQVTTISVAVNSALSDDDFDALPAQTIDVTTNDDDVASFTVSETGESTEVSEPNATDQISIVLGTQPDSDVVLTIASGDTGEATVSPETLTFLTGTWNIPQLVTITGVDDLIVDGSQVTIVIVSVDDANSDDAFDPLADQTVSVTTTDDDIAAFSITESGSTVVTEAGGTDTFDVELDRAPLTNVVIDLSSPDAGEVTVSPSLLTFTPGNWNTAQTVTVTGVDDEVADGDQVTLVLVSISDPNSDDAFDGVANQTVSTTTSDDDTAGFIVSESGGGSTVSESGTTDDLTVVLTSEPTSNVVIDVSSDDTGEVTVSPAQLTFTAADWDAPQTVTLTGEDDDILDGSVEATITLSINDASSDNTYDPLSDQTVTVSNTNDDAAGFTVTETGSTAVSEALTTDDFTVVLDAQPASDVVISVTSADVGEVTVDQATLTFTSSTWDDPQTVTVTGVDDLEDDGDQNTTVSLSVVDGSSDDDWDAVADQSVSVTTVDNDGAGFTIVESDGGTSVTEAGSSDTFTVVLTAQPAGVVRLDLSNGDTGEITVSETELQFNNGNWDTPQLVTVTGVDDLNDDGNQVTSITISVNDAASDDAYDPVPNQVVSAVTTDDDIAGFSVVESDGGTLVSEAGSTDDFTVVLTSEPVDDVILTVSSNDVTEASVSPATLTFTSANWNSTQTVTIAGVDDALVDNFQFSTVTVSVDAALSDDAYDPLADQVISVTTTDNEVAAYTVSETDGGTSVAESGTTDDIAIVLNAQPFGNVVFDVASSDATEVSLSQSTVVFNNGNWNVPQTVVVTGVDDDIDDGEQSPTVTFSINTGLTEDSFDGLSNTVVTVTVSDDDTAGFTLAETSGGTLVGEGGSTDVFTVRLDSRPEGDVVLEVVSADVDEATVDQATLTFTNANWNIAQTVTVTGIDDDLDDGDQITLVTISVDAPISDDAFDGLPDQTVSVTTEDDDAAGITTTESDGSTEVTEAGSSDTFQIVLDAQPLSDVVLDLSSGDPGEATISDATLTFTSGNWNVARTITVTGEDDDVDDGDQVTSITISIDDVNSDDLYDPVSDVVVSATTTDDDGAAFSVVESGGDTSVDETGTTDSFTVSIASQPESQVVIDVSSGDTGEATVSPAQLTFTPGNWLTAQTVTVTGEDDGSLIDGPIVTSVTLSINDAASDAAYDPLPNQQVSVTTTDDDVAGYTVTETSGSTGVDETGTTDEIQVVLTGQPEANVVFTVSSADEGEATVSPTTLTFNTSDWNTPKTITVTGIADAPLLDGDQTTVVTVAVNDILSNDAFDVLDDETVTVTTADVGTAAFSITESSGSTTVDEDGSTDSFTVELDVQPTENVVFSVVSGDTGEATVTPATLTFTNGNWDSPQAVVVTGIPDAPLADGDQTTTVTVSVDAGASYDPFDVVSAQNVSVTTTDTDAPGILLTESAGSTSVSEDGGTDTFTVELTAQPLTNVTVNVVSGDTGEFTVDQASLLFTPADWDQPQTLILTGLDDSPLVDGAQTVDVTASVDAGISDDLFDGVSAAVLSVTINDTDIADFTVTESSGTTVAEDGAGNTDSFDVVLDVEPTADVVINVSSGSPGEAVATPTSLTFTSGNWNIAQPVTVSGQDDSPLVDGTQVSTVTLSVDAVSEDEWDAVSSQIVNVSTTDTDAAGFDVDDNGGALVVTEASGGGNADQFTVVLTAQPDGPVVFDIASADTDEATVSPTTLVFSNSDWSAPKTVTVTGVDDDLIDGPQNTSVTVSIDQAGTTSLFDGLADQIVSVSTVDNDVAGFTVVETGGTAVTEGGSIDQFTVVLDAEPATSVSIDVVSDDIGEVSTATSTLVFPTSNWDTPQTVTVSGVNDDIDDGDAVTVVTLSVDDANSDDAFDALADQTVSVTTTDDDESGLTVVDGGGVSVSESGTTAVFTIELASEPTSNVVLDLSAGDLTEATVSPTTLTFTPADWDTPKDVTVTGVDDDIIDGDVGSLVTIAVDDLNSDDTYDPVPDATASVTTTDDDVAGITIVEEAGTTVVAEAAGTDTYTVVLDAEPGSDVVIDVTSADTGEVTASPATLTFTTANWNTPQTVTVTGVDEAIDDGDQVTVVTAAVRDISSDNAFNGESAVVSVTTLNNDTAGISVSAISGNTSEAGDQATFTIALDSEPLDDVTIALSSDDTSEGTVAPTSAVFTPANWNTPQTITVTGQPDAIEDGDQAYSIITAAASSTDPAYDGRNAGDVSVTNTDDDTAGITVSAISGSTSEPSGAATFAIVLDSEPTDDVTIGLSSSDLTEGTLAVSSATFTSANWSNPQTITVTGADDDVADGDIGYTIVTAPASSTDANYNGVNPTDVAVTNTDDDAVGITLSTLSGTTTEAGGALDFTIVLNSQPTADVTIGLSSSDTSEGTISLSSVTFTSVNWETPRTVTVSGEDDDLDDGDVAYSVVTAAASSSDTAYNGLNATDVTLTNTDDEEAAITVSAISGVTTEAGGTATFTIVLESEPTDDVTVALSSSDEGEGTLSSASVTFTSGNWNVVQTVTVTGQNDDVADGDIDYTIATAAATSTDGQYNGLDPNDVSVTNTDNDTVGFTVSTISGLTSEAGTTATFTIVLTSQPTADVTIGLTSDDLSEGTVSPASVTFTDGDWNVAETVTVTGVADNLDDGDILFSIVTAPATSADPAYSGQNPNDVSVTNTDDDTRGVSVSAISGNTSETGTQATFTIVLDSEPSDDVTISVTSSDTSEGAVSPASVTFTNVTWQNPQTVTVTGISDDVDDGDVVYTIVTGAAVSGDGQYSGLNPDNVSVTNDDDDVTGVTVSPISGPTTEAGGQATFTIALTSQPTANVTIGLTSDDTSEGTVSPASVAFTSANWATPQTVTVTGLNDEIDDGNANYSIVTAAAVSTDGTYSGFDPEDVTVVNSDDETAGITVSPTSGLTTTEAGGIALFTIVLDSEPTANVTIGLTSDDTSEGTVSPSSVVFTSANWDSPQIVTVTGVNDAVDDGDVLYTIVTAASTSTDGTYDNVDPDDVSVTNVDNDTAGVTVSQTAGLITTEAGTGEDTFTIVLDSEPTADVSISVASSDVTEGTVSATPLVFTSGNWSVAQTVTVTGVNDDVDDGDIAYTIVTADASSSDPNYSGFVVSDVGVTNTDDDTSGIDVSPTGGLVTTEAGGSDSFTIVLQSEPTADVSIAIASTDESEGTVSTSLLTFTSGNWNVGQSVTVSGVNDDVDDGDVGYTITTGDASSADSNYNGVVIPDPSVSNEDNDTAGITVSPTSGLTTTEAGAGEDTFTIVLDSEPTADVSISLTSSNTGEGTVSPANVTFTSENWNTARTITVTGVDDNVDDGDVGYTITTGNASSGDSNYNNVGVDDVSVTNTDDDVASLILADTASLTVSEDGTTTVDQFTLRLGSEPTSDVTVSLTLDATEVASTTTSLTFNSLNWETPQIIPLTGVDDASEADGDTITVATVSVEAGSATEYLGLSADANVTTVDDDDPGFALSTTTLTVAEGASTSFTVVLDARPQTPVTLNISSGDDGEATVEGGTSTTVTFQPGDWDTPVSVSVEGVVDSEIDGDIDVTITISVDDASSNNLFDPLADQTVTVTVTNVDTQ